MAFKKVIQTQFGQPAEYWKVLELRINYIQKTADVAVGGFLNKNARDLGLQPMMITGISFDPQTFPFKPESNILEVCYTKLKEGYRDKQGRLDETFKGAEDILEPKP